jgi:pimeloyl-ACP methyl ester carboxylesterase
LAASSSWAPYNAVCKGFYNVVQTPNDEGTKRVVFNTEILFASAGGEQQTMQLLPGLAKVQCPVLVMAGEQDPVTPLEDAQDIAAAIPAPWARLVTFPNAGHGAWRDAPDAAFSVLREFITDPAG